MTQLYIYKCDTTVNQSPRFSAHNSCLKLMTLNDSVIIIWTMYLSPKTKPQVLSMKLWYDMRESMARLDLHPPLTIMHVTAYCVYMIHDAVQPCSSVLLDGYKQWPPTCLRGLLGPKMRPVPAKHSPWRRAHSLALHSNQNFDNEALQCGTNKVFHKTPPQCKILSGTPTHRQPFHCSPHCN